MDTKPKHERWLEIVSLWNEAWEASGRDIEDAWQHAMDGVVSLVDAQAAVSIVSRQDAVDVTGYTATPPSYFSASGVDLATRYRLENEWEQQEPDFWNDPVIKAFATGTGKTRVVRHKHCVGAENWELSAAGKRAALLGIDDSVVVIMPLGPTIELYFFLERWSGEPDFSEREANFALAVMHGLRPLAEMFVRHIGLMPDERPLMPLARRPTAPITERVNSVLEDAEGIDDFQLSSVARRLSLSTRALQRELRAAHRSFRQVANATRHRRTLALLAQPGITLIEISQRLGYAQVSGFNRAVKRWTGQTPSELQRNLRAQAHDEPDKSLK